MSTITSRSPGRHIRQGDEGAEPHDPLYGEERHRVLLAPHDENEMCDSLDVGGLFQARTAARA